MIDWHKEQVFSREALGWDTYVHVVSRYCGTCDLSRMKHLILVLARLRGCTSLMVCGVRVEAVSRALVGRVKTRACVCLCAGSAGIT